MTKTIGILKLSTDDFGVANENFEMRGPLLPLTLFRRSKTSSSGNGATDSEKRATLVRPRVALSVLSNVNHAIKNLRYSQNLSSKLCVGYVNFKGLPKPCFRSSYLQFEDRILPQLISWVSQTSCGFDALIWIDSNFSNCSNSKRKVCARRPLLTLEMNRPYYLPKTEEWNKTKATAPTRTKRESTYFHSERALLRKGKFACAQVPYTRYLFGILGLGLLQSSFYSCGEKCTFVCRTKFGDHMQTAMRQATSTPGPGAYAGSATQGFGRQIISRPSTGNGRTSPRPAFAKAQRFGGQENSVPGAPRYCPGKRKDHRITGGVFSRSPRFFQ